MRFHVLAIPYSITRKDFSACAFTQNALNWCKMMTELGHTVYHYGHKDSEVKCTEHVPVTFDEDLEKAYPGRDWKKNFFQHAPDDHAQKMFNERAIVEVGKRKQPQDFLICFWGWPQGPVVEAHKDMVAVEPAIGTLNTPFTGHAVFASYSAMSYIYGKHSIQPRWYDAVIPHYFDPADFEYNDTPKDYFLYTGRVIQDKGVGIAIEMTGRLGIPLIVAGQGSLRSFIKDIPPHVHEIGLMMPKMRCEIMRNAKALIAPTHYNEPFGCIVVEAMFCGTPVISTDWGAFSETNLHGITGYRCRTMDQFIWAGKNIDKISRKACRNWAMKNYSLNRVSKMYEEYFQSLSKVFTGAGFYAENPEREELDWLKRYYPTSS